MATTDQGIWYPGPTDPLTPLENLFATMAASVDSNMGVRLFATMAAMNTAYGKEPFKLGIVGADKATGQMYVRNGNLWDPISGVSATTYSPSNTSYNWNLQAGWSIDDFTLQKVAYKYAYLTMVFTYTGPDIIPNAAGNFGDVAILTMPTPWLPGPTAQSTAIQFNLVRNGVATGFARINQNGQMFLTHGIPGVTLSAADYVIGGVFYPLLTA